MNMYWPIFNWLDCMHFFRLKTIFHINDLGGGIYIEKWCTTSKHQFVGGRLPLIHYHPSSLVTCLTWSTS